MGENLSSLVLQNLEKKPQSQLIWSKQSDWVTFKHKVIHLKSKTLRGFTPGNVQNS